MLTVVQHIGAHCLPTYNSVGTHVQIVGWIGLLIFFPLPPACVGPFLGCNYKTLTLH